MLGRWEAVVAVLLFFSGFVTPDEAFIKYITPQHGSRSGATQLKIFGSDFDTSLNLDSDTVTTEVILVSNLNEFACSVHDAESDENVTVCYTGEMDEGTYSVRMKIHGNWLENSQYNGGSTANRFKFYVVNWRTPLLSGLNWYTNEPQKLLNISGRLYTSLTSSNQAASTNGVTVAITRVWLTSGTCLLYDENDEEYGVVLSNEGLSNWGTAQCKVKSSYVGNQNVSFIVDGSYGRSDPYLTTKRVSADDQIYMVQTYAVVTDVSPKMGSTEGGTLLTITGRFFDDLSDEKAKVIVGGKECTVQSVTDDKIECITTHQPSPAKSVYSGGRGLKTDVFSGVVDLSTTLSDDDANVPSQFTDHTNPTVIGGNSSFLSRSEGFFVPSVSAQHSFILEADGEVEFFFNPNGADKDQAVSSVLSPTTGSAVGTTRYSLSDGQEYYFRVHHIHTSESQSFKLGVYVSKTHYTSDHTSSSKTEHQRLRISSTVEKEVQKVTFEDWSERIEAESEWNVKLECLAGTAGCGGSSFYFSIFGRDTDWIRYEDASAHLIQLVINQLGYDEVEASETTAGFTVKFKSSRGNWPLEASSSSDTLKVTTTVSQVGEPKLDTFTFMVNGRVSPPLPVGASNTEVASTLLSLFGPACPSELESNGFGIAMLFYDAEAVSSDPSWQRSAEQSFCGSHSFKNPGYLFNNDKTPYTLSVHKQVCFAYKGDVSDLLRISYSYLGTDEGTGYPVQHNETLKYFWNVGLSNSFDKWSHFCCNLNEKIAADHPEGNNFKISSVYLTGGSDSDTDLYLDNVFIGTTSMTSYDIQDAMASIIPSAVPDIKLTSIDVVKNADEYTLTFNPIECGNNFPLLGFAFSSSTTESTDGLTYNFADETPQIHVQRIGTASPPVQGTFDISFTDSSFLSLNDFPANISEEEFKNQLETLEQITHSEVKRSGSCHGYQWDVYFKSPGGDYPEIVVDGTNLISNPDTARIAANIVEQGGLYMIPIYGDFIRTAHSGPQVQVYINGIPSHCEGGFDTSTTSSCDFTWESSETPVVTDVNPSSASQGEAITITTNSLDYIGADIEANVIVQIGKVNCKVTSLSATKIVCTLGESPAGEQDLSVNVAGKGLANIDDLNHRVFLVTGAVNSFLPLSGSVHGCTNIRIAGTGFDNSSTVTIGGKTCIVDETSYSSIRCVTSAGTAGSHSISVTTAGVAVQSSVTFEYTSTGVAGITSVSPADLSAAGGETLTITGSGFGTSKGQVYFGDKLLEANAVTSWADTNIVLTTPSLPHGTYDVKVSVGSMGCSTPSPVSYKFAVSSIEPTQGSLVGGTTVTIHGDGLTNDTLVKFGDVTCKFVEVNAAGTALTCVTSSASTSHTITNSGNHPGFGLGYGWDPSTLNVVVGDHVTWAWEGPSDLAIGLFTTADSSSKVYDNNGFQMEPSVSGHHTVVINTVGVIYYGSGCIDDEAACGLFMRGTIRSTDPSTLQSTLSVTLGDQEAVYQTGSHTFTFDTSRTPYVTSISPRNGTTDTTIEITGSGFSSTPTVTVGGRECKVIAPSSETSISCKIPPTEDLTVATYHEVVVTIDGIGKARNEIRNVIDRTFVLLPLVISLSPTSGSLSGGTKITIKGSGFCVPASSDFSSQTVSVSGGSTCVIKDADNNCNTITCITRAPPSATSGMVTVTVSSLPSTCANTPTCEFAYAASATPSVSSFTEDGANRRRRRSNEPDNLRITFTGTGFGTDSNDVEVLFRLGDIEESCEVKSVTDTVLVCEVLGLPVGTNTISIYVEWKGLATFDTPPTIDIQAKAPTVSPSSGSTQGGTILSITGNGFVNGSTAVTIDGTDCAVKSVSYGSIECITKPHNEGTVSVTVTSRDTVYPLFDYDYALSQTPTVTSVSPDEGVAGDSITFAGTGFGSISDDVIVSVGGVKCTLTSVVATSLECTLGAREGGSAPIQVDVVGRGLAMLSDSLSFKYSLKVTNIMPTEGSYAGGQIATISGEGFSQGSVITICDNICSIQSQTTTPTKVMCITPANTNLVDGSTNCDVKVTSGEDSATAGSAYSYESGLTPKITSVSPRSGGTAGGTLITILGSGFSHESLNVTINGSRCDVQTLRDTEITCTTNSHQGSIQTKVEVTVGTHGIATQDDADFYYIDRWSSKFTWGGNDPPVDKDFVIIQKGQTVLLDTVTAVMTMLLIDGGQLLFEERDDKVSLHADNILITNGGVLQVGTNESPFMGEAEIVMHGHLRSPELPIYGAKTLAVRNGVLDLHGRPVDNTWTRLEDTANVGEDEIKLQIPVDWRVDDEIVIATTGLRHSQSENEKGEIKSISSDKKTLTLKEKLKYKHLGVTERIEGVDVDFRAEVGLLTRNVVFKGSDDTAWHDNITKCAAGFNTGMFARQTCFQGRFGEETGSDQFGASIMMHPQKPSSSSIMARIENIEVTYAGQAFRLGRYPIHWHLMGDVTDMYVKGCSIHKTFNRAVTIHGTHNLLVDSNVVYDVMGGAIFIEDGIETGNIIQYNLAVFVRQSTSLLNDDITPAAYWVTNPNNILRHNHAAGGTHFGFWYRMHEHPDGPSFDANICQQKVELGIFQNNTVHSQGWFGLWIFQKYFPMDGGRCDSKQPKPAKFETLTVWNCEKGAEWVEGGAIQFNGFVLINNEDSGIDIKLIEGTEWGDNGAMIGDALVAGSASFLDANPAGKDPVGITLPFAPGLYIKKAHFVNFNEGGVAFKVTRISGTCTFLCGGFYYWVRELDFTAVTRRVKWDWEHEGVIKDLDGTLTGSESYVVPFTALLDTNVCRKQDGVLFSSNFPSAICDSGTRFHRVALNNPIPSSLEGNDLCFSNEHGTSCSTYQKKRLTHKPGWMLLLPSKKAYDMWFDDGTQFSDITYNAKYYDFMKDDYISVSHKLNQPPDVVEIKSTNENISWSFNEETMKLTYEVSPESSSSRRKRAAIEIVDDEYTHVTISPNIYRCPYLDCIWPESQDNIPPSRKRPDNALMWSQMDNHPCMEKNGDTNVVIKRSTTDIELCWVVVDVETIDFKNITVEGVLEFENNCHVTATYILVMRGRIIAGFSSDEPFQNNLKIELQGNHDTPAWSLPGVKLGSKALGCFGGCDFHGKPHDVYWTHLAETANPGAEVIKLMKSVDWEVGSEIVITTTGYDSKETEKNVIENISNDRKVITLRVRLQYRHMGMSYDEENWPYDMRAEVGLLTRNIKIIGQPHEETEEQAFGARVLVGSMLTSDNSDKLFGWGRFSDVEFFETGQEGWTETSDPRFSLAWLNTEEVSGSRPSSVVGCAFHDGYSTAIGTFGASGISITDNVVHRTVHDGIRISGRDHRLERNLVTVTLFRGSYQDRFEATNFKDWQASFEVSDAENLTMTGNTAAGSERLCFHVDGEACDAPEENKWTGNVAHGCLHGVQIFIEDGVGTCSMIRDFTIYKAWDFGIYHQTKTSVVIKNTIIVDSTVGYLPLIFEPPSLSHTYADKYAKIEKMKCVGRSPDFNTDLDTMDENEDNNLKIRRLPPSKKAPLNPTGGKTCIMLPLFQSSSNGAPFKPFHGNLKYPTIRGLLDITGLHAQSYKLHNDGITRDIVFYTNPANEDIFHPTILQNFTHSEVDDESKVFLDRPSLSKINPSDCVDMECDGMKKVLIKDLDGGLLGEIGAVVPQAEFGWDDPSQVQRGLGDYRIPKTLLTATDGTRIPVRNIIDERGIIRSSACNYKTDWQAYDCHGNGALNYEMLVIESMDADTELRRLSPVALLGDRYIDLNNGPQDHGWCAGYTCQKRISTFYTIVASGKHFDIFFTGYAPKKLRLHLLNVDDSVTVRVAIWYARPERLDVYKGETYISPRNWNCDAASTCSLHQDAISNPEKFKPSINSEIHGDNFLDLNEKLLYITLRGPEHIEIRTTPAVYVKLGFPAVTVDNFFEENLKDNLAFLLGVPTSKIRFVDIVRESRRKRDTSGTVTYTIMYSDEIRNTTADDNTAYSAALLNNGSTAIVLAHQTGTLSSLLGANVTTLSITQASDSGTEDPANNTDIFFTIPTAISISSLPGTVEEYLAFAEQPVITLLDDEGSVVNLLDDVFEVTVTLDKSGAEANPAAQLTGTTSSMFSNGMVRFTDLLITHNGNYNLRFQITKPLSVSVNTAVVPIVVSQRRVSVAFVSSSDYVFHGEEIAITLELQNSMGNRLENIGYKGHTWKATASLNEHPLMEPAQITPASNTTFTFEPATGRLTTTNLMLSDTLSFYKYSLQFRVYTEPDLYDITTGSLAIPFFSRNDTISLPTNNLERIRIEVAGVQYRERIFASEEMFGIFMYNFLVSQVISSSTRINNLMTTTTTDGNIIVVEFDLLASNVEQLDAAKEALKTGLESELPTTGVSVASQSCIFEVNNVCYGTTSETNPISPASAMLETWVYVVIGLVIAILLAAAFIATSCFLKRAQSNKVSSSGGCLDASSSRGSTPLGDSFYTGSSAFTPSIETPTGGYYPPRTGMTPVQT